MAKRTEPDYTDRCKCGHDYGAHFSARGGRRSPCGDCDECEAFTPASSPAQPKLDGWRSGSRFVLRCQRCQKNAGWGRSPLCFYCLGEVQLLVTAAGDVVDANKPSSGRIYAARYRYRPVRCGKPDCKREPHYWYCYRAWRVDGRAREKYMGPAEDAELGYELPRLRAPRAGFGL